ncbi:MAG TPA: hypothetical protein VNB94_04625 [Mycobacteriales bacterium]|nr:hypothetical protein [Mycobacteriales bacterium]
MSGFALEQALELSLPGHRWFAGKGRTIAAVTVAASVTLVEGPVEARLVTLAVRYDDDEVDHYQLPLGFRRGELDDETQRSLAAAAFGEIDDDGPVFVYDALADPSLTAVLLDAIAEERVVGPLTGHRRQQLDVAPGRLLAVEQSNSSVVFGDSSILKFYRRLQHGRNPDLEVVLALSEIGSAHVAPVLGWLETTDPFPATVALLQPFYRSGTDGWVSAVASVRDLFAERDLHAAEVGGDFAGESNRLGQLIASLHADLIRALPVDEAGPAEHSRLATQLHDRLREAVQAAPELESRRVAIAAAYDEVGTLDIVVPRQRVHGDLHLGQLLRVDTGWVVLDFEGEPARSLAERTALMSPLRDIAGMLRSFDYAARHLLSEHPGRADLEYRAAEWADRNREAFCDGYTDVSTADPRKDAVLLRAFELDKAVYETVYESRNRPTWIWIPLAGIDRLIGRATGADGD